MLQLVGQAEHEDASLWNATFLSSFADVLEMVCLGNDKLRIRDGEMVDEFRHGVGGIAAGHNAAGANDPQPEWSVQDLSRGSRKCQHSILDFLHFTPLPPSLQRAREWTTYIVSGMQADAVAPLQALLFKPRDQLLYQRQCLPCRDGPRFVQCVDVNLEVKTSQSHARSTSETCRTF